MKTYLSWSGGKDSTASIILCYEKGIPLDGIVMSEVMFDHSRNISGENPKHIKWVYETAIPIIENVFGYNVIILKDDSDYIKEFYHILQKSKIKERNGKCSGFFLGGMCVGNDRLKMRPLRRFFKEQGNPRRIVGIAVDEPKRLARLKQNTFSVLANYNITEDMTYDICQKYNLLSPIYSEETRGGCWFCPNQSVKELAKLNKEYPELWEELKKMSKCENLVSEYFMYNKTFQEIEEQVNAINNQLTLFDFMKD